MTWNEAQSKASKMKKAGVKRAWPERRSWGWAVTYVDDRGRESMILDGMNDGP